LSFGSILFYLVILLFLAIKSAEILNNGGQDLSDENDDKVFITFLLRLRV